MNVHKITIVVIDFDQLGAEDVKSVLEDTRYPNHCISPNVAKIETADCGEWHDDHPLNRRDSFAAEVAKLFPNNQ